MKTNSRYTRVLLAFIVLITLLMVACDSKPVAPTPLPATPTVVLEPTSTSAPPPSTSTAVAQLPTPPATPTFYAPPDYAATSTAIAALDPWKEVSVITDVAVLASQPGNSRIVYAGVYHRVEGPPPGSVLRSTDAGLNWRLLATSFQVDHMSIAPSDPDIVYAGTRPFTYAGFPPGCAGGAGGQLHRTTDGGLTWVMLNNGAYNIDINPDNPEHLVALECAGPVKSTDGGETWARLPGTGVTGLSAIRMMRGVNDRGTIYVVYANTAEYAGGGVSSVVQRTTDDGRTWTTLPFRDCAFPYVPLVDPLDAAHVYLPCTSGFFTSTDAGNTWTAQNGGLQRDTEVDNPAPYPMSEIALDNVSKPTPGAANSLYMFHVVFEVRRSLVRWNGVDAWEDIGNTPRYYPNVCCLLMVNDGAAPALLTATAEGIFRMALP